MPELAPIDLIHNVVRIVDLDTIYSHSTIITRVKSDLTVLSNQNVVIATFSDVGPEDDIVVTSHHAVGPEEPEDDMATVDDIAVTIHLAGAVDSIVVTGHSAAGAKNDVPITYDYKTGIKKSLIVRTKN